MPKIIHPDPVEETEETEETAEKAPNIVFSASPDDAFTGIAPLEPIGPLQSRWEQREEEERAQMTRLFAQLDVQIEPALLKQRASYEGAKKKLTYAEWHTIVRRLNQYFGHDGWTTRVESLTSTGEDHTSRVPLHVSAIMVLTVNWPHGGVSSFTNVGSAVVRCAVVKDRAGRIQFDENGKKKYHPATWEAYDMAVKTAVHDGIKRCATALGDAFGLFLYDEDSYTMPEEETGSSDDGTTKEQVAPTPIRRQYKAEYPVATGGDDAEAAGAAADTDVAECEQCGKEIKGYTSKAGKTYTTADLVSMSKRFANGRVLCYDCRQK